jgi:hypothetical protein
LLPDVVRLGRRLDLLEVEIAAVGTPRTNRDEREPPFQLHFVQ